MLQKSVKAIMEVKVISLPPEETLSKALSLMADNNVSFIVIASKENIPLGVITEQDILKNVWNKQSDDLQITDVMSSPVFTTSVDEDVMSAIHTLVLRNIRHLVVVDKDKRICGVLTLTDFLQKLGFEYFVNFKDVDEIMDSSPLTLPAEADAFDALSSLSRSDASCLIAMEDNRPTGILTERDALRITQDGQDLSGISLREVMKSPVIHVQEGSCVFEALSVMNKNKIRHLPVINSDGELSGLTSQVDVAKGMELSYTAFMKKIIEAQERKIREANDRLEEKVAERTAELTEANERLQREIKERKQAEEALRAGEERYERAEIAGNIGSWDWNILSGELHWSDMIYAIFGFRRGEFGATYGTFLDSVHPDDRQFVVDSVNAAVEEGKDYAIEHRIVWPDKTVRWVSETGAVFRNEKGKAVQMLGVVRDITERKQAVEALRESEEKFRGIFNNAQVALFQTRISDGKLLECNERLAQILDYKDRNDCISHFVSSEHYLDPGTRERMLSEIKKRGEVNNVEIRMSRKDGAVIWIRYSAKLYAEKGYLEGVATDITEQKQAEGALKESEEQFRLVVEKSPVPTIITDKEGNIEYFNDKFIDVFGWTTNDVRTPDEWWNAAYPDKTYRQEVQRSWEKTVEEANVTGREIEPQEWKLACKNGEMRNVEFKMEPVSEDRSVITMIDITERKHAEEALHQAYDEMECKVEERTKDLAMANSKLKELDKLKSMFIASMSHELRTPLNSIIGFTGVTLQGMTGELNDKQKDQLQRVYRNARHLLALITDVIDISKLEAGKISPFAEEFILKEVIDETVDDMMDDIERKRLAIEVNVPPELQMKSDRRRMLECILNLLSNAVKYTEEGKITIDVKETDKEIEVSVSDTGIGIAREDMDRLFMPFERLNSHLRIQTPGTGLGLYLCKNLAREVLGGDVSVSSKPGRGSAFILKVPKEIQTAKAIQSIKEGGDEQ